MLVLVSLRLRECESKLSFMVNLADPESKLELVRVEISWDPEVIT